MKTNLVKIILVFLLALDVLVIAASIASGLTSSDMISFDMKSSKAGDIDIFYDIGEGFNGRTVERLGITGVGEWAHYRAPLPARKVVGIRFDPNVTDGNYQLRDMRVSKWFGLKTQIIDLASFIDKNRSYANSFQIESFGYEAGVLTVTTVAGANDPQIYAPPTISVSRWYDSKFLTNLAADIFCLFILVVVFSYRDALENKYSIEFRTMLLALSSYILGADVIAASVWKSIAVPFHNPLGVVGPLALMKFSPNTNFVRYLSYIAIPSLLFIAIHKYYSKNLSRPHTAIKEQYTTTPYNKTIGPIIQYVSIAFVLIFGTGQFLRTIDQTIHNESVLDLFHEGEFLAPALNVLHGAGLWTGTYFLHGAFYDPLSTVAGWTLFGVRTIGASRMMNGILFAVIFPALAALIVASAAVLRRERGDDPVRFGVTAQVMLASWLLTYQSLQVLDRRDLPVVLGVAALVWFAANSKRSLLFFSGLMSAASYFYTIDRGAYYTALLVLALLYFHTIGKDRKSSLALLAGLGLGWIAFLGAVGPGEFTAFLKNTALIYKTKDLFDSYVYPRPSPLIYSITNFSASSLASINPHVIAALLLATTCSMVTNKFKNHKASLAVLIIFAIESVFYYRSSLGRSDIGHIMYGSAFIYIGVSFLAARMICGLGRRAAVGAWIALTLFNTHLLLPTLAPLADVRPAKMLADIRAYAAQPDENFYSEQERVDFPRLADLFKNEKCLFDYSDQPGMEFVLDRPTCGTIHIVWFASPEPLRRTLLRDLTDFAPTYILFDSPQHTANLDGIDNATRFPDVDAVIRSTYQPYADIDGWKVYRRTAAASPADTAPDAIRNRP